MRYSTLSLALVAGAMASFPASVPAGPVGPATSQPVAANQLDFPEGTPTPRGLTAAERRYLEQFPIVVPPGARNAPPPTGDVRCPGEYEPMDGLLIAWEGSASWLQILAQMTRHITTTGNADVYVAVDTAGEQGTATTTLTNAGANMARVRFVVRATDTIWIRDYGPRYIYEGQCRAIVDHVYNRPRPNDNTYPVHFAQVKGHARYDLALIHGGGNFHLDGIGRSYVTRLINNENPLLTETEIHDLWQQYQNVDTHFFTPFRTQIDSTQHIDMWVQVIGDNAVVISDWPFPNEALVEDGICDAAAVFMADRGYTVHRVPARSVNGVHYTYTNVVMCNDLVLLPIYTNASVAQHNAAAATAWAAAVPGKTVTQINCEAIVSSAGVMHCIVMHMPSHLGGVNPTAFIRSPRGGETFMPGGTVEVRWISDDDSGTTSVDVLLSLDGGATYPIALASTSPDDGSFMWTVPDTYAADARIRVVARDAQGNTGFDSSPAGSVIDGCRANFDADGSVTVGDFLAFLSAYAAGSLRADLDGNGAVTVQDFLSFINEYALGCD